jgi:hypothetical protein
MPASFVTAAAKDKPNNSPTRDNGIIALRWENNGFGGG